MPREGGDHFYITTVTPVKDETGQVVTAICSSKNITERKQIEQALQESEARLTAFMENVPALILIKDHELRPVYANEAMRQVFPLEDWIGKKPHEIFPPDVADEMVKKDTEAIENGHVAYEEVWKDKQGNENTYLTQKFRIQVPNRPHMLGAIISDVTEKSKKMAEIEYLSFHDQLTGLYNRRFFEVETKRLDVARNLPISLVMADVNGLKLMNDVFGHTAGDRLLQKVADVIKRECRADDIFARVGGDEFMLLLPKTSAKDAEMIVRRILAAIAEEKVEAVPVSISVGRHTKRKISEDMADVYKRAEDNMYRNKLSESPEMRRETVRLLVQALHAQHRDEEEHALQVGELCEALGAAIGLESQEVAELRLAGYMHDLGKIMVADSFLEKPGLLDEAEWFSMRRHAESGYRIFSGVQEYLPIAESVLAHHERWDGTGYPNGLAGSEIPLKARIIAIAEAYHTMITDRPYQKAVDKSAAIHEIEKSAGTQFDPCLTKVFANMVRGMPEVFPLDLIDRV